MRKINAFKLKSMLVFYQLPALACTSHFKTNLSKNQYLEEVSPFSEFFITTLHHVGTSLLADFGLPGEPIFEKSHRTHGHFLQNDCKNLTVFQFGEEFFHKIFVIIIELSGVLFGYIVSHGPNSGQNKAL